MVNVDFVMLTNTPLTSKLRLLTHRFPEHLGEWMAKNNKTRCVFPKG
ncbi:hypothetical protein ACLK1S_22340 [Escherichia coli]